MHSSIPCKSVKWLHLNRERQRSLVTITTTPLSVLKDLALENTPRLFLETKRLDNNISPNICEVPGNLTLRKKGHAYLCHLPDKKSEDQWDLSASCCKTRFLTPNQGPFQPPPPTLTASLKYDCRDQSGCWVFSKYVRAYLERETTVSLFSFFSTSLWPSMDRAKQADDNKGAPANSRG